MGEVNGYPKNTRLLAKVCFSPAPSAVLGAGFLTNIAAGDGG